MDIEAEISDLKRRVEHLEGAINVLTGQLGSVHPDLTALAGSTSKRFDGMEVLIERLNERVGLMNTQVWSLRDDLPDLITTAVKQAGVNKN